MACWERDDAVGVCHVFLRDPLRPAKKLLLSRGAHSRYSELKNPPHMFLELVKKKLSRGEWGLFLDYGPWGSNANYKKNTSTLKCLDITTLFLATEEPNDKLPMVAILRSWKTAGFNSWLHDFHQGGSWGRLCQLAFRRPNTNNIMNSDLCYTSSNWFINETFQDYFAFPMRINIHLSKWKNLKQTILMNNNMATTVQ